MPTKTTKKKAEPHPSTSQDALRVTFTLQGAALEAWRRILADDKLKVQDAKQGVRGLRESDLEHIAARSVADAFLKPNDPAVRY